jgi:predicted solute-binding protein
MKKIADFGKEYTRKIEHIKRSHRREASKQFISQYIVKMNKTCKVCQSKAIQSKYKITCVTKTPR